MAHTNMSSSGLQEADIKAGCRDALNEASPATPTADSVFDRLKTLIERLTETRANNLDNLDKAITALESAIRGADNDTLKTISDQLDNVPSSSDYTSERASKLDNLDQAVSTTESNIRGADNDDLKAISDQIDDVKNKDANATYDPATDSLEAIRDKIDTLPTSAGVSFEEVTDQSLAAGAIYTPSVTGFFTAGMSGADLTIKLYSDDASAWITIGSGLQNWTGVGIANKIRFKNGSASENWYFVLNRQY